MSDILEQGNDQELVNTISELAISLSSSTQTDIQIDNFFRLTELPRKRLPRGSSHQTAANFLAITISIISLKDNTSYCLKAIKTLHQYLRYDEAVFQIFRPHKPLLRKMNLQENLLSTNPSEVETTLDLTQFLLRYHRSVDYGDFSDNPYVVQRIRRYHDYKIWYELEEVSGSNQEISENFGDFKGMTQKALQDIVAHLTQISADLPIKFQSEAQALSMRVNRDIAVLNDQFLEMRSDRHGLASENYKKLLEMVMTVENKIQKTNQNLIGDLKQEFLDMINTRDQTMIQRLHDTSEQLVKQQSTLSQLQGVKGELEQIIKGRSVASQQNFDKLFHGLQELENTQNLRWQGQINELKSNFEEMVNKKASVVAKNSDENIQRISESLDRIQAQVGSQGSQLLKDLVEEIDKVKTGSQKNLDASSERMMLMIRQLGEGLGSKHVELSDSFNTLKHDCQRLISERARESELQVKGVQQRALDLITDIEKKLMAAISSRLDENERSFQRQIDENKTYTADKTKQTYEQVLSHMIDLEKRTQTRQGELILDFKRDFTTIIDEQIARVEGLTNENYKKALSTMLEMEKRLNDRQTDLLTEMRNDFAKVVTQLDSTRVIRDLEDSFGRKIKTLEQAIVDQERHLTDQFDTLIRQADAQIQRSIQELVKNNSEEITGQLEASIDTQIAKMKRIVDGDIKKAKDVLTEQIQEAIEAQQRSSQGFVKTEIEQVRNSFDRHVEKLVSETSGRFSEAIDKRITEVQSLLNRGFDAKIQTSLREVDNDFGNKMKDGFGQLWTKIVTRLSDLEELTGRQIDGKIDSSLGDITNKVNQKVREVSQTLQLEFQEKLEDSQRTTKSQIERATVNLTSNNGEDSSVSRAQAAAIKQRVDQLEKGQESSGRKTDEKLAETKAILQSSFQNMSADLKRQMEQAQSETASGLDSMVKSIVMEKIDSSREVQDRDWDSRMKSEARAILGKAKIESEEYAKSEISERLDKLHKKLIVDQNQMNEKYNSMVVNGINNLVEDWQVKLNTLRREMADIKDITNQEVDNKINALRNQNSSTEEIRRGLAQLEGTLKVQIDAHETQLIKFQGQLKAQAEELNSSFDIKLSNSVRNIGKSINERIQTINNDFSNQYKNSIKSVEDKIAEMQVLQHQLSTMTALHEKKIQGAEMTLAEQVDIQHNQLDRLTKTDQMTKQALDQMSQQIKNMDANMLEVVAQLEGNVQQLKKLDEIKAIITVLQNNDDEQSRDIIFLKDRITEELEAKVTLILRNRVDLLKRIEQFETEQEKATTELGHRLSGVETFTQETAELSKKKVKEAASKIQQLEDDVRMKVDSAIRELEGIDLKQQKELSDLADRQNQLLLDQDNFKSTVSGNLQTEFEKVNKNFMHQAKINDKDRAVLRQDVQDMINETQQQYNDLKIMIDNKYQGASEEELEKIGQQVGKNMQSLSGLAQEIATLRANMPEKTNGKVTRKDFEALQLELAQLSNMFGYYMQFVVEQCNDKIRLTASKDDHTVLEKFEAFEWTARNIRYLPSATLEKHISVFRSIFMSGKGSEGRDELISLEHHVDATATIIANLVTARVRLENPKETYNIVEYDNSNMVNLEFLEAMFVNNQSVAEILQNNGIEHLARLLQEQPMPSEVDKEFFYDSRSINKSFKVLTRALMQAMRMEAVAVVFVQQKPWVNRLLQILEEFEDSETLLIILRTLNYIFLSDQGHNFCRNLYPSMAEFLIMMAGAHLAYPRVRLETCKTLDTLMRYQYYAKLIKGQWQEKLVALSQDPVLSHYHQSLKNIIQMVKTYGKWIGKST